MKNRHETRKLKDVKETFFVRTGLNQDRVNMFADLYRAGAEVPRMLITEDGQLVRGHHRKAALELLGVPEIEFEVTRSKPRTELILEALEDNMGGSLPLATMDMMYTVKQLLNGGMSQIEVVRKTNAHSGLPVSMCKQLVAKVRLRMNAEKTAMALDAIAEQGISVKAAAEKFGIGVDVIKDAIKGRKKTVEKMDFRQIQSGLSSQFRSASGKIGATMRRLFEAYHDGLVGIDLVKKVVDEMERHVKKMAHGVSDWQKRIAVHCPTQKRGRSKAGRKAKKS